MTREQPLSPTCSLDDASRRVWDVLVVGAGPSGAIAARQLSQSGLSVLLVDKAEFPRRKVCGCFVNGSALATLRAVGLHALPDNLGAPQVTSVRMGTRGHTAELSLPPGAAISREAFDTWLVKSAIDAGSEYLCRATAKVGDLTSNGRQFQLQCGSDRLEGAATCIVVADGVGGQSLKNCRDIEFKIAPHSLVGTAAMTDTLPANYVSGTIHMAIGRCGYVGALQLESGQIDVAAAFDPTALKQSNPGALAQSIADQSGLPEFGGLDQLRWLGTPPLSRTPTSPAAARLFLVGDAGGYVEPFTGEGISWAVASGRVVAPVIRNGLENDFATAATDWTSRHRKLLKSRKRLCRLLTRGLRIPWLASCGVHVLNAFPSLATPVVRRLNRPPGLPATNRS